MAHRKIGTLRSKLISRSMTDLSHIFLDRSKSAENISDAVEKDENETGKFFKKSSKRFKDKEETNKAVKHKDENNKSVKSKDKEENNTCSKHKDKEERKKSITKHKDKEDDIMCDKHKDKEERKKSIIKHKDKEEGKSGKHKGKESEKSFKLIEKLGTSNSDEVNGKEEANLIELVGDLQSTPDEVDHAVERILSEDTDLVKECPSVDHMGYLQEPKDKQE